MSTHRTHYRRWPRGTWMKLTSPDTLKELLLTKGLSYADLGRAAGVSRGFISHLTAGRKKTMTPIVAYRIAERLDIPLSVLFEPRAPTTRSNSATEVGKAA